MSEAKAISKQIKERGLKKTDWYCEMCKKQCRDENGFKNHCLSGGHLANMELYQSNPKRFTEDFSAKFEKAYMDILLHGPGRTKRVNANSIYNEMIQDKQHIHMNSTKWDSLGSFVMYLGATGKCRIDQDERGGWWIKWIDPEVRLRENVRREKEERDAEAQRRKQARHMNAAQELHQSLSVNQLSNQEADYPSEEDETIQEGPIKLKQTNNHTVNSLQYESLDAFKDDEEIQTTTTTTHQPNSSTTPLNQTSQNWMTQGIVVKILSSQLNPELKYQKGVVVDVIDNEHAELCMLDTGNTVSNVPQQFCETVVPAIGNVVKIVGGPRQGLQGILKAVQRDGVLVSYQQHNGRTEMEEFDHVCKLLE
jgi:DNA/RNA-binding protein KIN17